MEPRNDIDTIVTGMGQLISGTRRDQMQNSTPCSQWNVRDLITHVVGGGHMFAAAFRGESASSPETAPETPDVLGDDPAAAFEDAVSDFDGAVKTRGNLDGMVTFPFAELPATVALDLSAVDLMVHSWDLAQATDQTYSPSPELVSACDGFAREFLKHIERKPESFDVEVNAAADASPLDSLIAFTGRRPRSGRP
jgi:uncharacterized protein (TIGR03086 family)